MRSIGRSARVSDIDRLEYSDSFTEGIQLEMNGCRVGICQQSNATDCRIAVPGVDVQRVDEQFQKVDHLLEVLQTDASRRVQSEYHV